MRLDTRSSFDDLVRRFFDDSPAGSPWPSGGYTVPTDIFHAGDRVVVRMDLPGVNPEEVEVSVAQNAVVVNGKRTLPRSSEEIRWLRRGTFYGEFTNRIALGDGLELDKVSARYDNGVLELTIPVAESIQPKRIEIEVGGTQHALAS